MLKSAEPLWALGAMSGTSLDGVDAALLLTDGETIFDFGDVTYRRYRDLSIRFIEQRNHRINTLTT